MTDMAGMFFCCLLLSAADVSFWDVSRVTSCDRMFAGCRVLKPHWFFPRFHLGNDCVNGNLALIPREWPFVFPMKLGLPCTTKFHVEILLQARQPLVRWLLLAWRAAQQG